MQLGGKSAGGVDQNHIRASGNGCTHRIKAHRCRVGPVLGDQLHQIAIGPGQQLLLGRGAKRVTSGQQHLGPRVLEVVGQFANRGGFAGPIHAGEHHDKGVMAAHVEVPLQGLEQFAQNGDEQVSDL